MIKSMTGFGKAQAEIGSKKISVQIKSLNSKQLDFYLRAPAVYKDRELDIRSMVLTAADRGKIEMSIQLELGKDESNLEINTALFKSYFQNFKKLNI